jgi:hypothetical protein
VIRRRRVGTLSIRIARRNPFSDAIWQMGDDMVIGGTKGVQSTQQAWVVAIQGGSLTSMSFMQMYLTCRS